MLEVWLPLLLCAVIASTWFHVLRLRERATEHARRLCDLHGLQLLDGSVSLHRLRIRWQRGGLCVTREYRFDTSRGGHDRQAAHLTLRGGHITHASLPEVAPIPAPAPGPAPAPHADSAPQSTSGNGNVVSIRRARRTLH